MTFTCRSDAGQIGIHDDLPGSGAFEEFPRLVTLPADAGRPVHIASGVNHNLVITDRAKMYSWGFAEGGVTATGVLAASMNDSLAACSKVNV